MSFQLKIALKQELHNQLITCWEAVYGGDGGASSPSEKIRSTRKEIMQAPSSPLILIFKNKVKLIFIPKVFINVLLDLWPEWVD